MIEWDYNGRASNWWYVLGFLSGIGLLIALIYVLVSNSKNRIWALFYLIGIIGEIIIYILFKNTDKKLADLTKKLLIGQIIMIAVVILIIIIFIIYPPSNVVNVKILNNLTAVGFNGLVIGSVCNSTGLSLIFHNILPYNIIIKNMTLTGIPVNATIESKLIYPSSPTNPIIASGEVLSVSTNSVKCTAKSYMIPLSINYVYYNNSVPVSESITGAVMQR